AMSLPAIGLGYLAIGGLTALAIAGFKRRLAVGDALLVALLWPLYAPLSPGRSPGLHALHPHALHPRGETELLAALSRAKASPLASVLPDAESARVLGARLREAGARLADLDEVLARPDFDPATAERRASELAARGATAAAA